MFKLAARERRSSILRQFLSPVLVAVLLTGFGVAIVSKWAADRSSRMASAMRMNNIGQIIAQSSYPKSANVLDNLKKLTRLEFVSLRDLAERDLGTGVASEVATSPTQADGTSRKLSGIDQATIRLNSEQLSQIQSGIRNATQNESRTESGGKPFEQLAAPNKSMQPVGELLVDSLVLRWTAFHSDGQWLVVLEPESVRGDGWFVFSLPLVTGLLSSCGIAIVAAWTARRLSRRIETLEKEVAEIAVGRFVKRDISGPRDAIRSLQASLYLMGEQLEDSKRQIEVNERTRLIHMIGSGLAHELRNHLSGARLALQTVEVREEEREGIEISLKQLDLAETQIRRLLAIRPGGDTIDSAALSVASIQDSVMKFAAPIASHQKVDLRILYDDPMGNSGSDGNSGNGNQNELGFSEPIPDLDRIQVNSGASMVGVILNVVLNAVEAVGAIEPDPEVGRQVHLIVGLRPSDSDEMKEQVVVSDREPNSNVTHYEADSDAMATASAMVQWIVQDNGPGPTPNMANSMFEPFATTKREGIGLGLAMCKHVVENCGGTIRWQREQGWTQFVICTPVKLS